MFLFFNKPKLILGPTQAPLQRTTRYRRRAVVLITQIHLAPSLRRTAIPVLPAYVFTAQTETTLICTCSKRLQGKVAFRLPGQQILFLRKVGNGSVYTE